MTAFLWMISFLLHIILLYAVYSLFKQLQENKSKEKAEIEYLLAHFMDELQKENEKIAKSITEKKPRNVEDPVKEQLAEQVSSEERVENTFDISKDSFAPLLHKMMGHNIDEVEISEELEMIQLYQEGKTIEEIARSYQRGKTEVELIVRLQNN